MRVRVCDCGCLLSVYVQASGQVVEGVSGHSYGWDSEEESRPSVFLLNHAAAYAAWYQVPFPLLMMLCEGLAPSDCVCVWLCVCGQSWDSHVAWMGNLTRYLDNGKVLSHPATVAGRPGISRPMKLIWFGAPFVFSPAHAGTDYVTTYRHQKYDRYAQGVMRGLGVPVVDAAAVTQSQWESAYDGLHYLRGGNDNWIGSTSGMVFQVILNTIFPNCVG